MDRQVKALSAGRFSCMTLLATMFLVGMSGPLEAAALAGKTAIKTGVRGAGKRAVLKSTTAVSKKALLSNADMAAAMVAKGGAGQLDTLAVAASKQMDNLTASLTNKFPNMAAGEVSNLAKGIATTMGDDFAELSVKGMDNLADSAALLGGRGVKLSQIAPSQLAKLSRGTVGGFDSVMDDMLKQGVIEPAQATAMKQSFKSSKGALTSVKGFTTRSADAMTDAGRMTGNAFKKTKLSGAKLTQLDEINAKLASKNMSVAERKVLLKEAKAINKIAKTSGAGRFAREGGMKVLKFAGYAGATITAAILFMVPSVFQSAFLAQQHQNALLQTYVPPIKFGNVVMQLPDSVIDMGNPIMSQFIYYGIPVNNPNEKLSDAAKAAYPGVSGPTKKNKVSAHINNAYAEAFSLGSAKNIEISRYNLDARALSTLPIFVSYTDQSWADWGDNGIPDAAFSQSMINLNTGYIFYADGTSQGLAPAPLIGAAAAGKTVQSYLSKKYGKIKNVGKTATYTEFHDTFDAEKAGAVADPVANQFNCECLTKNNGVLSADTMQTCSSSTCLLSSVLQQLSAGLVLNSQGTVMAADQDLAAEIAQGALGQVIPIQGLGKEFDAYLQAFPGAAKDAIANSGVLTISVNDALSTSAEPVSIQGADPDNYSAKGVYVYQCKNTPLAKILRSQSGGSGTAASNDQITDFIVFLDRDLNQVPMMAPVQDPNNYNFIRMGLNPAIKYFSTIIGNVDANGAFSFLPQLNIQSPAALIAKGLPANFAPLYGLQATNGSLSVNYNQNLTATVGGIAQALASNAKLGQQFKHMQSAMLLLITGGPFGKYNLVPVDAAMQPSIGGVDLMLYTGYNGYPVSQDKAHANCGDVLIPLSSEGKTVSLPSNNVAQYYGLVTDFTYTVLPDGALTVDAAGFANSPMSASWAIDAAKVSHFYWIDKLTAMGKTNDPSFAMPASLVDFVKKARTAWVQWVQATAAAGLSKSEFTGVAVPGTSNVLTIASQQALAHGLYIYSCSPCPSSLAQDYFVLTNSSSPQAADKTLGTMSAATATAATNMLSIVSGLLYTSAGILVKNSAGSGYSVNSATVLKALNAANPKGFSDDLKAKLNISSSQSSSAAMKLVFPFQFGDLQLGMYQADINTNTYLYVDAAGAGASADFQPDDYFVTVDSFSAPVASGLKLSVATHYMVSLVSGKVYGAAGVQAMMSADVLKSLIASLSPRWRAGVVQQIATLTQSLAALQKSQEDETAQMDAAPIGGNDNIVTWDQDLAKAAIASLASQAFLPDPYGMLKQDPTSGKYALVTPANADETQFMYTFFDVPNNLMDAKGNNALVGGMYDEQGNLLHVMKGLELISSMSQYGVGIDSARKQTLGANNILPIMQLDPADYTLKPGASGKSMIVSSDAQFPSRGIASPVSYQNSKFYFYYNTIMKAYYVMEVNGSSLRYIDIAGGNVYNQDGSPRSESNPVAVNSSGDAADLLLPYVGASGLVQCVMQNKGNTGVYCDFFNLDSEFKPSVPDVATQKNCGLNSLYAMDDAANNVLVAQMPFPDNAVDMPALSATNQYNVYWDPATPVTYTLNAMYEWRDLNLLPINIATRAMLAPLPDDMYSNARLVMNNGVMYALVFANKFYSGAKAKGTNSYTMTSGSDVVTVSIKVDKTTNVNYVEIVADSTTYNYQTMFMSLSDDDLQNYRDNAWQVISAADATGKIIVEKYMAKDASGNPQLLPVGMKSVANAPSDPAAKSALNSSLGLIKQEAGNGRFFAPVDPSVYSYVPQGGYVNLEDGLLFDSSGACVGAVLQPADFIGLLQELSVSVVRDPQGNIALRYRSPIGAINPAPAVAASAPAAQKVMAVQAPVVAAPAKNLLANARVAAPVKSVMAPVVAAPVVADASQYDNSDMDSDMDSDGAEYADEGSVDDSYDPSLSDASQDDQSNMDDSLAQDGQGYADDSFSQDDASMVNQDDASEDDFSADDSQDYPVDASNQSRSTLLGRLSSRFKRKSPASQAKHKKIKAMKGMAL